MIKKTSPNLTGKCINSTCPPPPSLEGLYFRFPVLLFWHLDEHFRVPVHQFWPLVFESLHIHIFLAAISSIRSSRWSTWACRGAIWATWACREAIWATWRRNWNKNNTLTFGSSESFIYILVYIIYSHCHDAYRANIRTQAIRYTRPCVESSQVIETFMIHTPTDSPIVW